MNRNDYVRLLRVARRWSRRPDEAEDLVQEALLEALRTCHIDPPGSLDTQWLAGVIRNKARIAARGASRRRRRETDWQELRTESVSPEQVDLGAVLSALPPALKSVAALTLSGHNRREIAYLLDLPDTALRQRITALKRLLIVQDVAMPDGMPALSLDLAYGRIRNALLPALMRQGGVFASHDPDGHLFVVHTHKPAVGGN